jgi:hypothetical protein
MENIKVAAFNASTAVKDADVASLTKVLQKQVDDHFAPAWGCRADLRFVPNIQATNLDEWWLGIFDYSDQAGVLGYHDLTDQGLPFGKVFAKTAMDYDESWTVCASHELLEMLADPDVSLTAFMQGPIGARLYSYEVCDACEDDRFGYKIDGTLVSDFVLPAWFESFRKNGSTAFDFREHISEPFQLLEGGYIGINDLAAGAGWQSITADGARNPRAVGPQGSRRQRRTIPADERIRSAIKR